MSRYPRAGVLPDDVVRATALAICAEYGLTVEARQIHHYVLSVSLNHGSTSAARALGVSRPNVIRSCGLVEDMRDNPEFEKGFSALEARLIDGI